MSDPVTRLNAALEGRYAIERELGEGGMATVYLADDLKHERKVALKVLKPELAAVVGAERFLAEIKTTANLQHPHILPLFDSGEAASFLFYVMPHIQGESLRERIDREKQLPVDEAVKIATDLAEALDYAHRHKIIHRDIKPANILIHEGRPLIADFGIALAVGVAGGGRLTETGLSVGTPHYMSPEQATGDQAVGVATDIYALGAVLYEMLIGDPPYTGSTAQAILGKIIQGETASATEERASVPRNVDAAIRKALEKLPADRFTSAQGFVRALGDEHFRYGELATAGVSANVSPWNRLALTTTAFALLSTVLAVAFGRNLARRPTDSARSVQFVDQLPDTLALSRLQLSFSQDGTRLVMGGPGGPRVRDLAQPEARRLDLGRPANNPLFSSDGDWIAYWDVVSARLDKLPVSGGVPITIVDDVTTFFGGAWGPTDTIIYSPETAGGLWQIFSDGGTPRLLTTPDVSAGELGHWYPQFLPGGRRVLFSVYRTPVDSATIEVLDLETLERTRLVQGGHFGRYVPTGHLVFMYYETLYAVPFDLERLQVTGSRVPVLTDVAFDMGNADGGFAISEDGTLAYIKASSWDRQSRLVWVERDGTETPLTDEWSPYVDLSISPDGSRVAYVVRSQEGDPDLWVYDLARDNSTRLTRRPGRVATPAWAGERVIYQVEASDGVPHFDLFWRDWQAGAPAESLLTDGLDEELGSVSPDGRVLAFVRQSPLTARDIWTMPLDGQPQPFRETEAIEEDPVFSSNGRWLAYGSDESGRREIWLESYPDAGRIRRQITTEGGRRPRWGPAGELFYQDGDRMMSVRVDLQTGEPGSPTLIFEGPYRSGRMDFDVMPDGQRFLMIKPRRPEQEQREVVFVLNWFRELRERVPN
jgi:serine/threonine-protein kinase